MEGFAVTCPLAPNAPRLLSGFCSSPRSFGFGFFQTPPRDDALAVSLAFGSAYTWLPDFHRHSSVPCSAHTSKMSRASSRRLHYHEQWCPPRLVLHKHPSPSMHAASRTSHRPHYRVKRARPPNAGFETHSSSLAAALAFFVDTITHGARSASARVNALKGGR